MKGSSLDIQIDQLEKLKQIFPETVTEGKIDWEKLQATLGKENLVIQNERYVLNWAGKAEAFKVLQQSTTATLKPVPEESINFETTENIFIEGENLEVLKVLQKAYYNKIKCIIIDPPYNTGNDSFIYPDSFKENKEEYLKRIGEKDEEGYLMKEGFFRKNSKDSGHYHSNWLSMMYPRLFLAKNLLRDDGVIFVHIDDNEVHNLRLLMNEIWGEENFITTFSRLMKTGGAKGRFITPNVEFILVYAKDINSKICFKAPMKLEQIDGYYNKIESFGIRKGENFGEERLYKASLEPRINQRYWIKCPDGTFAIPPGASFPKNIEQGEKIKPDAGDGVWKWIYERYFEELKKDNIVFKETSTSALIDQNGNKSRWNIYNKLWLKEQLEKGMVPANFIDKWENRESSAELKALDIPFDFAKPTNLIKYILELSQTNGKDIILDFFAGSASTGEAVLKLNKEDGGNRKFILVQLPEPCDENSEAFKAGYKTIADISKERIRRVIKRLNQNLPDSKIPVPEGNAAQQKLFQNSENPVNHINPSNPNADKGFKVFKLSSSNFKIWRGSEITEENLEQQLDMFTDPVREGSEKENMLYELILKAGYLLTDKVELMNNFYSVNEGELVIVLEEINQPLIETIISAKPKKVITLDRLFRNNDQLKTNAVLQMKDAGIDFKTI